MREETKDFKFDEKDREIIGLMNSLGMNRNTLRAKIKKLGINTRAFKI